jgi:hypothetical protein
MESDRRKNVPEEMEKGARDNHEINYALLDCNRRFY